VHGALPRGAREEIEPAVLDANLPTLSYDVTDTPSDVYPQIRAAATSKLRLRSIDTTLLHLPN
jgi:hypothetical protein